jgi:hypothetical protein
MSWKYFIIGRLGPHDLPFWDMLQNPTPENVVNGSIATFAASLVIIAALGTVFLLTWFRGWKILWTEWLTSVDHKRIGIMYLVIAIVMMLLLLGSFIGHLTEGQWPRVFGLPISNLFSAERFMTLHISTQSFAPSSPWSGGIIPIAREIWEGK